MCSLDNVSLYSYSHYDSVIFWLEIWRKCTSGVAVTQSALNEHLGSAGGIFLTVAITLFAFSSVGNYYYGQSNIEFLSKKQHYLSLDV